MKIDLAELRREALEAVKATRAATNIADIELEADEDNYGSEFLRVIVRLNDHKQPSDDDLLELQDALQDRLIDLDERFPSVRFPDAA